MEPWHTIPDQKTKRSLLCQPWNWIDDLEKNLLFRIQRQRLQPGHLFLLGKWRDLWQFSDRARAGYGEVLSHACVLAPGVCICWTVQVDAEAGAPGAGYPGLGRVRAGRIGLSHFFRVSLSSIDILPVCCCCLDPSKRGLRPVQFCLPDHMPGSDDLLQALRIGGEVTGIQTIVSSLGCWVQKQRCFRCSPIYSSYQSTKHQGKFVAIWVKDRNVLKKSWTRSPYLKKPSELIWFSSFRVENRPVDLLQSLVLLCAGDAAGKAAQRRDHCPCRPWKLAQKASLDRCGHEIRQKGPMTAWQLTVFLRKNHLSRSAHEAKWHGFESHWADDGQQGRGFTDTHSTNRIYC